MTVLPKTLPCARCGKPNKVYAPEDMCLKCQSITRRVIDRSTEFVAEGAVRSSAGWGRVGCISGTGKVNGWVR
jgi:hypothetical protein